MKAFRSLQYQGRLAADYDRIFNAVVAGSNVSRGATHNASAGVARRWNLPSQGPPGTVRGFDGQDGTDMRIEGELFYSKVFEQQRLRELGFEPGRPRTITL